MKIKTINSILNKKFNEWLDTIDDPELKDRVKDKVIITGGCITSMLLKEKINDFDLYFTDLRTTYDMAKYYHNKFMGEETEDNCVQLCTKRENENWMDIEKDDNGLPLSTPPNIDEILDTYKPERGEDIKYRVRCWIRSEGALGDEQPEGESEESYNEQYDPIEQADNKDITEALDDLEEVVDLAREKYKPTFITDNAITLTDKIQMVLRFYGEPEIIHDNYDFVHVTNYWDSKSKKVTTNKEALESIIAKELKYTGSRYPLASLFRTRKFIQRGWTINVGQILKAVLQLNDMDLNNPHVFAAQVTGVDVHYMNQLVKQITRKVESDPSTDIKSYAMTIINKIFG